MKKLTKLIALIFSVFLLQNCLAQNEKIELYKTTSLVIDSKDNVFVGDGQSLD
jgi:hypothetical protein